MGMNLKKIVRHSNKCTYTLMLMRHAKTESDAPNGDRKRELTEKGIRQAKRVSKGLVRYDLIPDRIICSGAQRARQTLDRMLKPLGDGPDVQYSEDLYESGTQAVLDQLSQTQPGLHRLLIIGHEPTMSISSQWLAKPQSDPDLLDLLNLGLSPANIVILGAEEPFNQWQIHSARLLGILAPHDFDK